MIICTIIILTGAITCTQPIEINNNFKNIPSNSVCINSKGDLYDCLAIPIERK